MEIDKREAKEFENRRISLRKASFDRFMSDQTTRLLISMVGESKKPEVLETLLFNAFQAGQSTGEAGTLIEILTRKKSL